MKGITNTTILIIGSIFFLFIAIAAVFQVWPLVRYGIFSPCWASAESKMNVLSGIDLLRTPQEISLGDCLLGVYFENEDGVKEAKKNDLNVDCGEGKSFVIMVPGSGEVHEERSFWEKIKDIPKDIVNKFLGYWKRLGGIKPICKVVDKDREFKNPYALQAGSKYCIKIQKTQDGTQLEVESKKMEKDDKCNEDFLKP